MRKRPRKKCRHNRCTRPTAWSNRTGAIFQLSHRPSSDPPSNQYGTRPTAWSETAPGLLIALTTIILLTILYSPLAWSQTMPIIWIAAVTHIIDRSLNYIFELINRSMQL